MDQSGKGNTNRVSKSSFFKRPVAGFSVNCRKQNQSLAVVQRNEELTLPTMGNSKNILRGPKRKWFPKKIHPSSPKGKKQKFKEAVA